MRVLVDSGPLSGGHSIRGIGVNTRGLLLGLKSQKNKNFKITEGDVEIEDLSKYDLVHFTAFRPFFISIPWNKPSGTKFVLTIHDLIQLIYPQVYKPGLKGIVSFWINKYRIKKNIDAIITISETSKKDICRFLEISPNKVHVIYLAAAHRPKVDPEVIDKVSRKYNLPEKFALYVGDVNYNKNINTLVKACKAANIKLVVAGKQAKDIENQDLSHPELIHLKSIDWSGVSRLGFVPDEDLVAIYKLATLYIQASLYEGFGLPVLEAFSVGCPVVAGKTQALVEIADGGALFADPKSPADFAQKIKAIMSNKELREQLINTGYEIVKNFTWEKTGKQTLQVYEKV